MPRSSNPREKDLVLVNSAPSPLNPCLPLALYTFARALSPRLSDRRAFAPIGAHGHWRRAFGATLAARLRRDTLIPSQSLRPHGLPMLATQSAFSGGYKDKQQLEAVADW